jgi:hypothetical protein
MNRGMNMNMNMNMSNGRQRGHSPLEQLQRLGGGGLGHLMATALHTP